MRKIAFLVCIGIMMTAACANSAIADSNEATTSAIKSLIADFTNAWVKSDAHALSMFWTPDGDFINPNGIFMTGREQIEEFYSQAFSAGYAGTSAAATVDKIRSLSPTLAIVDGTFEISSRSGQNGTQVPPEKGRYTALVTKRNGHWWILSNREMEPLASSK